MNTATHTVCPLGISLGEGLTAKHLEILRGIETANLDFVAFKLLEDKKLSRDELPIALQEFKRFCALVALEIKPLAIIGPKIDEVWHQFILFTSQYQDFCTKTFGYFVNHQPNTPGTPVPAVAWKNFMQGYKRYFGEVPSIWFSGLDQSAVDYFNGLHNNQPLKWSGWTG